MSTFFGSNYFLKIKDKRVKNVLRGLIGKDDAYKVHKALNKIKSSTSTKDYSYALESLRESILFEKNGVVRHFTNKCPVFSDHLDIIPDTLITTAINNHKKILLSMLQDYQVLLNQIRAGDVGAALENIQKLVAHKGFSCFLIRVLFFIKNNLDVVDEPREFSIQIERIFDLVELSNVQYIENAIRELINPRTEYLNIYKRVNTREELNASVLIAKNFTSHIPKKTLDFAQILSSYYNFSLIDAFLFIASTSRAIPQLLDSKVVIDKELLSEFRKLSEIEISDSLWIRKNLENEFQNFFKESFLLIELNECFNYRAVHGALYNISQNKFIEMVPYEKAQINKYFESVNHFSDLCFNSKDVFNVEKFNSKQCCLLENSTAFIYLLNVMGGNVKGEENAFVKLMSSTKNIGNICPQSYLLQIEENAVSDEFKLVVSCLISIGYKNDVADHTLRSTIQDVISNKGGDILDLIIYLYTVSPSVTEHLIQVCDETFISKLFYITDKPIDAIETRSKILDWYGKETNEEMFEERARNLRIDVQISKQKDTIDDSRIYVDPVKYIQWVTDNILDHIVRLLENSDYELIDNPNIEWDKVSTGITLEAQIGTYLLLCYTEFCKNKFFGIASYLGRRIRHGTFEGTGLKEVKEIHQNPKYYALFLDKDFTEYFNSWLSSYESMLNLLKIDYLHINSKKSPNGLVHDWFNTKTKFAVANNMYREVCNSYYRNENIIQIPYLILDYCWRFIEEDLADIRSFLLEKKSQHGVFCFPVNGLHYQQKKLVQEFSQEINSITTEKFRSISSWFNKPSIASPSAKIDLLFNAVISEVKDYVARFEPNVILQGNLYYLNGSEYFVVYDALYILIFNAAVYGRKKGNIKFIIDDSLSKKFIRFTVVSEVESYDSWQASKRKIKAKLYAANQEGAQDANITEKGTGIKKLKLMEKSSAIDNVTFSFIEDNEISASFDFYVSYMP